MSRVKKSTDLAKIYKKIFVYNRITSKMNKDHGEFLWFLIRRFAEA